MDNNIEATNQEFINRLKLSVVGGRRAKKKRVTRNEFLYKNDDRQENMELLDKASSYYQSLQTLRDKIERNSRYLEGDQWGDLVYDPDNDEYLKEGDLIKSQGQVPFVMNLIAPIIENIKGQFRSANSRPTVVARTRENAPVGDMLTNTLWAIDDLNNMWLKDSASLETFLTSGIGISKVSFGPMPNGKEQDVRYASPEFSSMFFNAPIKQDYDDITLVGEMHDMTINEVISAFAKSYDDEVRLRDDMFSTVSEDVMDYDESFSEDRIQNKNFFYPKQDKCRVFEIWQKRSEWRYEYHDRGKARYGTRKRTDENRAYFDRENQQRLMMAINNGLVNYEMTDEEIIVKAKLIEYKEKFVPFWYVKFVTNMYETLMEGETPYTHGMHPYVFLFHPLTRGKVRPFIDTLIDIQRKFNRDHILYDFVIGSSSKGTFVIDEESLGDDFTIDDATAEYTKRNGVIKVKLRQGQKINDIMGQLSAKAIPVGLNESISLGMNLMNQIGGISDAAQGRTPGSGTPASLYAQSAHNSSLNIKDRLEAYNWYRARRGKKSLEVGIQHYDDLKYLPISGNGSNNEARIFDKSKLRDDLKYDMTIGLGADSQMYRAMMDDWINGYVMNQLIPMEVGLKNLSFPGMDKLLNDIEEYKKAAQQGQVAQDGSGAGGEMMMNTPDVAGGLMSGMAAQGADPAQANQQGVDLMQRFAS